MIEISDSLFCLHTRHTTMLLRRTHYGHFELVHYGARVSPRDADALGVKNTAASGCSVNYAENDPFYTLDAFPLAFSGAGRGDFRESPLMWDTAHGAASDFVYDRHELVSGSLPAPGFPGGRGGDETLILTLADRVAGAELDLVFTLYPEADVITRRSVLRNTGEKPIVVKKLMSSMLDLPGNYVMTSFHGAWTAEAHRKDTPVTGARVVIESLTGFSSNLVNPGFLLSEPGTEEDHGRVYGFNLVWSGNHYASAQRSHHGITRIMHGVSPTDMTRELSPGEAFYTPEAVMSFSPLGFNGLSAQFHDYVNHNIVPSYWEERERPVLYNSWEGCGMDFTEHRLVELGKKAAQLGCELFVLDDGWFGARNDDHAGLGDYNVNRKKLPGGLSGLAEKLKSAGLSFGLWFEPEAVNPDSDLYRAHPDWVIGEDGRENVMGRNELLLDLTRQEVRDYIVKSVGDTLDSADIAYVKWDMNRHSTALGAKAYDYILGLYEVLGRIFGPRPEILLENCASGGNRFDLGLLCYGPQTWTSDDTDPVSTSRAASHISTPSPAWALTSPRARICRRCGTRRSPPGPM